MRNELVERYRAVAVAAANRMSKRLPKLISEDDLLQEASIALMRCIDGFDPSRGIKFSTFASRRVWCSMLDWLREMDWAPRLARSRGEVIPGFESLHALAGHDEDGERMVDQLESRSSESIGGMLDVDSADGFQQLIRCLGKQERDVIQLVYLEDLTLREVGQAMGLSESRVSQIRSSAIAQMKATLTRPKAAA